MYHFVCRMVPTIPPPHPHHCNHDGFQFRSTTRHCTRPDWRRRILLLDRQRTSQGGV